jgi:hypothetical protein
MLTRTIVLLVAILFIAFFAVLTIGAVAEGGVNTPALVASVVVLALLGFGILGAMRGPPEP